MASRVRGDAARARATRRLDASHSPRFISCQSLSCGVQIQALEGNAARGAPAIPCRESAARIWRWRRAAPPRRRPRVCAPDSRPQTADRRSPRIVPARPASPPGSRGGAHLREFLGDLVAAWSACSKSNPTRAARLLSLPARISAGSATRHASRWPASAPCAAASALAAP